MRCDVWVTTCTRMCVILHVQRCEAWTGKHLRAPLHTYMHGRAVSFCRMVPCKAVGMKRRKTSANVLAVAIPMH